MLCPICNTDKKLRDFKRTASLAQTRAWLKKPTAMRRMTYLGSDCNACHKLTKRNANDLTPEEYRRRLINEGTDPEYAWYLYQLRVEAGKKKLSASGRKALKIQREPLFTPVLTELNKLVDQIRRKQSYIRKTDTSDEGEAAIKYLDACLAQVSLSREKVIGAKKAASTPPPRWQPLMPNQYNEERDHLFEQLSGNYKDRFAKIQKHFL